MDCNLANEIILARDGVEALDYLFGSGDYEGRNVADLPVVMILDLKLPRANGFDVLKRIRSAEHTKYLPVVILTSSDEEKDIIDGYKLGANSYVSKPIDFNDFTGAVKSLGLYWLILNRPPIA
jgi:two-component system response regulator